MAPLAFKPYTYKPTIPRSKSTATHCRPAPEQVSILNKLQHITSGASLNTLRLAANDTGYRPGIRGTGTVFGGSDKANSSETDDDERDLPTIEELLFTNLQAQGFTTGDRDPAKTSGVEEIAADKRGGSVDQSRSAQSDNLGKSSDDPIVLGNGNLSASKAKAKNVRLRAESAIAPGTEPFDSPETAVDSTTPAPPCSFDRWHGIDVFPETAPCLPLAEQEASTPESPHTPSHPSSKQLHDGISGVDHHPRRARSEATTSSSARPRSPPPRHARASPETQLSEEGRLYTDRGLADGHEIIDHALDTLLIDKEAREQQEVEQEKDKDNDGDTSSKSEHPPSLQGSSVRKCRSLCEDSVILGIEAVEPPQADVDLLDWEADSIAPMQLKVWPRASVDRDAKTPVDNQPDGLQHEVKDVAVEPTAKRVSDTHLSGKADKSPRPAERRQLLPDREPSPATSRDEAGCNSHSDGELNNTESDEDDEEPRPVKRKRPSSFQDGSMHKKPKHRLQQKPTGQQRPRSKPHGSSPKLHSLPDQASKVAVVIIPKARPSTPNATGTDVPLDYGDLDRSSRAVLPTLAEATFRPHTADCCSFKAVIHAEQGVSFGQLSRLIASIGHMGKIDDFNIKPMEQHSFIVTGFSRYNPSRLSSGGKAMSTAAEAGRTHKDATRPRPQHRRAADAQPLASQGGEPSSSNDDSGWSDSDTDVSSDDDGCSSEAEKQRGLSVRMNIPWDPVDEQRLVAWKKEKKSWEWIFEKFPDRTEAAVRTRWTIAQRGGKQKKGCGRPWK